MPRDTRAGVTPLNLKTASRHIHMIILNLSTWLLTTWFFSPNITKPENDFCWFFFFPHRYKKNPQIPVGHYVVKLFRHHPGSCEEQSWQHLYLHSHTCGMWKKHFRSIFTHFFKVKPSPKPFSFYWYVVSFSLTFSKASGFLYLHSSLSQKSTNNKHNMHAASCYWNRQHFLTELQSAQQRLQVSHILIDAMP